MPKLSEVFERVIKTEENERHVNAEELMQDLGIGGYLSGWEDGFARFKGYWITRWLCTDTWVGVTAYFLDGEPVATSVQTARKNDEQFFFISEEAVERVRMFIYSVMAQEEKRKPSFVSLDHEIEAFYTVAYGSQIIDRRGFYNGEACDITEVWGTFADIKKWQDVRVKFASGEEKIIPTSEFKIPIRLEPA